MRFAIALLAVVALSLVTIQPAEAGPLRRIGYRVSHPFAPLGSYSGPKLGDGTWGRRFGVGQARAGRATGGCAACGVP